MMGNETYDLFFLNDMENWLDDATIILEEAQKQKRWDNAIPFLFRTFHSLKGAAPMAGMPELGKFLHRLEDLLASIQNGNVTMDSEWSSFLLATMDVMYRELEAARQGESLIPFIEKHKEFIAKLPSDQPKSIIDPPQENSTMELPKTMVERKVPQRLVIIYFLLVEDVQMPEVAVLVLEKQYQEVGRVQSMVLALDGDRQVIIGVIETNLPSSELEKIAIGVEIEAVYVQKIFNGYRRPLETDAVLSDFHVKLRVLLVDDDADLLMLMWKVLERRGYSTVAVTTAEEALQLVDSEKFHVLITDISLPGLNGLELVRLVKKRDPLIQVVVMTGVSAMQNAVQALELGATEYLIKPLISMGEMVQAVEVCEVKLAHWWSRLQEIREKKGMN